MKLPIWLVGLTISRADPAEAELALRDAGPIPPHNDQRVFLLRGSTYSGYVVAGKVVVSEDDAEYDAPSKVWPDLSQ